MGRAYERDEREALRPAHENVRAAVRQLFAVHDLRDTSDGARDKLDLRDSLGETSDSEPSFPFEAIGDELTVPRLEDVKGQGHPWEKNEREGEKGEAVEVHSVSYVRECAQEKQVREWVFETAVLLRLNGAPILLDDYSQRPSFEPILERRGDANDLSIDRDVPHVRALLRLDADVVDEEALHRGGA